MPIVDFKEIPEAHIASGNQDQFELFCQEFLKFMGMEIISVPDRGADGGKDLLCIEKRKGILGYINFKWLVSCKHKAHTGNAVLPTDEENIWDRVTQHGAQGFMGFYSTILSAGLNTRLNSYKEKIEVAIFNAESIETMLLSNSLGNNLFKRFFPKSYDRWNLTSKKPSSLFDKYEPLYCDCCGKDLLDESVVEEYMGMIAFVSDRSFREQNNYKKDKIVDIYCACKGNCDRKLEQRYTAQGYSTGWEDISDLKIPYKYVQWIMANMNNIREGNVVFEDDAYAKLKHIILCIGQYVIKGNSDSDIERIKELAMLPEGM